MSQTMIISHVIVKALVEEFKRQPECLRETTEKKHNFFGIDEKIKNNKKNLSIKARFMANSLSNLVESLSGGIHKTKCK